MKNPSQLVALLEQDYAAAKKGGRQDMRETLMAGLNWDGAYWVNCALKWIEQGADLDNEIVDKLETISSDIRYPQGTRHLAFKLAKRWRRSNQP